MWFVMNKQIMVIFLAMVLTSCPTDGGTYISPLPSGVYIAGTCNDGEQLPCYWTGGRRVVLNGYQADSITVSDNKVLVTGFFLTPYEETSGLYDIEDAGGNKYNLVRCYWLNGSRNELRWGETVMLVDGKAHIAGNDNFWALDAVVHDGKVYAVGIAAYTVCYFIDNERYDIVRYETSDEFYYYPDRITVTADGAVFVAGHSVARDNYERDKCWYYTGGKFTEIRDSALADPFPIRRIIVSDGTVYVFDYNNVYWVDGEKVTPNLPEGSYVFDYAVTKDNFWMVGSYQNGNQGACYWVDGERYDLDGSMATAIFVAE